MKYSKVLLVTSISLGFLCSVASAAVVNQTSTMTGSQSWNDGAFWSNEEAPSAGNDYVTAGTLTVRTPGGSVGNTVFAGNSLTLRDTASLFLRANSANQATISRLIIETNSTGSGSQLGPRIHNAVGGETRLNGAIELTGNGSFTLDPQASDRTVTINSQLTAASTVQQIVARGSQTGGTVVFTNSANQFSGTWVAHNAVLRGTEAGAFGSGSFLVKENGVLDFGYNFVGTQSSLVIELGGVLMLSRDLTFSSLSIAGTSLDAGRYSFDELNAQFDGYFSGTTGIGSVTVVPEPSQVAFTMVGVVGALVLCQMRRRRR